MILFVARRTLLLAPAYLEYILATSTLDSCDERSLRIDHISGQRGSAQPATARPATRAYTAKPGPLQQSKPRRNEPRIFTVPPGFLAGDGSWGQ